jgi:uncharacterized protein YjbI with pentapeptide repeats
MMRRFMVGIALGLWSWQALPLLADPTEQLFSTRACPECNLRGQDLSNRALNGANLSTANLRNVDLQNSNLRNANLIHANLEEAYLYRTNLQGANLTNANLRNAILIEADLRGAKLTDAITLGAVQSGAKFCRTVMPDGKLNNQDCRLLEN